MANSAGNPDGSPDSRPSIGRIFGGRYRIERELGAGGLGAVFVARHETLGRDVAIKLMHADVASRPEHRQRFEREARALAQLRHPNIVTVLDFGIDEETSFLVMELAEGRALDRYLAEERPSLDTAIAIVRQLLRALSYAHAQKIVHRDLKPANLVVRKLTDGSVHVVVLDFGIAKILEDEGDVGLTKQGAILGTPAYMAPEQASGGAPKPSLDVYAAGLVAFEVLTGRRPFIEADRGALLRAQIMSPPPLPSSIAPEIATIAGLDAFILRSLEKKPANRYADATQMLEAFERLVGTRATSSPSLVSAPALSPSLASLPSTPSATFSTGAYAPAAAAPTMLTQTGSVAATELPKVLFGLDRRLVVGLGIAGVVFAIAVIALIASLRTEEAPVITPPAPMVLPGPAPAAPTGPGGPLDRGIPPELESLHRAIVAGGQPSRNQLMAFYRYNSSHEEDARGLLILGRTQTDRRWYSEATSSYRDACLREPASKNDARLRRDLIHFAPMDRFGGPASRVIEACLGNSAIGEVEAALANASSTDAKGRLSELLARLRAIR